MRDDREDAIQDAIKELQDMRIDPMDASERSAVRWGFAYGAAWASNKAFKSICEPCSDAEKAVQNADV